MQCFLHMLTHDSGICFCKSDCFNSRCFIKHVLCRSKIGGIILMPIERNLNRTPYLLDVPPNPVLSCLVLEKLSPDELLELPSPPLFQRLPLPLPAPHPVP